MYQKSQPEAYNGPPQPGRDNIRERLTAILEKASSIHGHVDGLVEGLFGPRLQEASNPIGQTTQTNKYPDLLDNLDFRLREIDKALEFLSARL